MELFRASVKDTTSNCSLLRWILLKKFLGIYSEFSTLVPTIKVAQIKLTSSNKNKETSK